MNEPRPAPPAAMGVRGLQGDLHGRQIAAAVVVACSAALALAFFVLREVDLRDGPAIVVEDPRVDGTIAVAVAGAVATPGVYDLPNGARVDDAVARAGGANPEADLSGFNLARRLDDGEQLTVPRVEPAPTTGHPQPADGPAMGSPPTATTAGAAGTPSGVSADRPIDINTAGAAELETLPEIGATRAAAIVAHREANGPFANVEELADVDGISERMVEVIRPFVVVGT